ncbi:MAG TPA: molybdopterin converting factor subunit 1 [Thermoanaerobaculia bacterium]|nr:molybdopterin converting factor subunit 1 [Thermoanaerobaculia bacterium]
MRIRLLHFASFREAVGRDEEAREVADGTRVDELWTILGRETPALGRFRKAPPAAVNREYAAPETVLRDGDEVAFLPPVAGG